MENHLALAYNELQKALGSDLRIKVEPSLEEIDTAIADCEEVILRSQNQIKRLKKQRLNHE